jgi:hypothetical protein
MPPRLKISNLISLQDARSSAAVGFDLISFNLTRGDDRKLSAALVWNMVQWLSGPEIVLELNVDSLPELEEAQKSFQPGYISLPFSEWSDTLLGQTPPLILKAEVLDEPEALIEVAAAADAADQALSFELALQQIADVERFEGVMHRSLVHFPSLEIGIEYLRSEAPTAWGISLDREAEEEPGLLDYERIDEFVEAFEARYPAD